ncbi:MAG: ABC transporter substrate-binding protein [Bacteroidetes bacterium]|nr:ABC transporter substrate-binding protein [Bacteroidota bacterium]
MNETAVVALSGDADTFNPIVSGSATSGDIQGNIYPMMFDVSFDPRDGSLQYDPGLVVRWESANDGLDMILHLRTDVRWEDGILITPEDIKFSFSLYGDPEVASPRRNYVESMIFTDGKFDPNRSIEIIDDSTMVFHFAKRYPLQLFHLNLHPIPKHIYRNADRKTLRANPANEHPVGAGPFKLDEWVHQQQIDLVRNPTCTLPYPAKLDRVIFRIISEPTTRLTELKKGTVDVMSPVYPDDVKDIQENNPNIRLETLPPRSYEYIGWMNIDIEEYHNSGKKNIKPHPLFGDARVRQALTYAINRKGIMEHELGTYGELAVTDFSPIFRWAIKHDLIPYPHDQEKSRQLLRSAGWSDTNGDGILDKGGRDFEFTLYYNIGNKRREYVATVVQKELKDVGIKVNLQSVEPTVLFQNIEEKRYDAFIGGFRVKLAIDPSDRWGDVSNPFNTVGFQNRRIGELLKLGLHVPNERDAGPFWKEVQSIIHQEQPCTFLYWNKDIVGVNRRLKNTNINVLGVSDDMWDWQIGDPNSYMTY